MCQRRRCDLKHREYLGGTWVGVWWVLAQGRKVDVSRWNAQSVEARYVHFVHQSDVWPNHTHLGVPWLVKIGFHEEVLCIQGYGVLANQPVHSNCTHKRSKIGAQRSDIETYIYNIWINLEVVSYMLGECMISSATQKSWSELGSEAVACEAISARRK
jgi:hypothetical protein